ncbi:MAG: hypothetical protein AAF958_20010 [Planctomycetota bacterium]
MFTDRSAEEAKQWVETFDHAIVQCADAWDIPRQDIQGWSVDAAVLSRRDQFESLPFWDASVPDFRTGYALGNRLFVYSQPGDYYTGHLLLHEAVHALMFEFFDTAGPTWFQEGTAEWLGTHRGIGKKVKVGVVPDSRKDFAYWGRFKKIAEARAEHRVPSLVHVMKYPANVIGDVRAYSFSWAAIRLFADDPDHRQRLLKAIRSPAGSADAFNRRWVRDLGPAWPELSARWMLWVDELDYGFDPSRHHCKLSRQTPRWNGDTVTFEVDAGKGWQAAPVRVDAGMVVHVDASGQCTIDHEPGPWRSEPDGVSLRYVNDFPVGRLLAALVPTRPNSDPTLPPLRIEPIGRDGQFKVHQSSWLVFKINDQTGELADNTGSYRVQLSK